VTRGILVSGTGTGVGKTVVAAGLLALLRRRGVRVAAYKPVASGVPPHDDAELLSAAAGGEDPLDRVNPIRFREPLAPAVAAEREGRPVDPAAVRRGLAAQAAGGRFVVVEGAGGLLVPFTWTWNLADLAREEDLGVLLVGRAALGALHDGAASAEAARARGLRVLGFVLVRLEDRPDGAAEETNPGALARLSGVPVLGVLPRIPADRARDPEALADALATARLEPLWKEAALGDA
jgi:dethiobiotin synthetase